MNACDKFSPYLSGATLLRDGVPHGVWFVAYEWSKRHLSELTEEAKSETTSSDSGCATKAAVPSWSVPVCAGAFAATVAWGVGYPADTIKTRIQSASLTGGRVPGVMETAATMVRETEGNVGKALYRGFGLKLLRTVPASAVAFFAYEECRSRWIGESKPVSTASVSVMEE